MKKWLLIDSSRRVLDRTMSSSKELAENYFFTIQGWSIGRVIPAVDDNDNIF